MSDGRTVSTSRGLLLGICCAAVLVSAGVWAPSVSAQDTAGRSLPARLGSTARTSIQLAIDSARAAGLPTEPLAAKAAEGVLKGADDQRIVDAVRSLAHALGQARAALGADAGPAVLAAGASALRAGVTADALHAFAQPQADSGGPPVEPAVLATALVTLVDLVAKGVPTNAASGSIEQLLRLRAPEARFVALRRQVERDIRGGESPAAALTTSLRDNIRKLEAPTHDQPPPPPNPPDVR
ncbi:MAG TPA: hypothetical protein VIC55_12020 [Gemmatimonadaceae bacterium]|jgi:hypothetical protein